MFRSSVVLRPGFVPALYASGKLIALARFGCIALFMDDVIDSGVRDKISTLVRTKRQVIYLQVRTGYNIFRLSCDN